jgi:hypothetical protein
MVFSITFFFFLDLFFIHSLGHFGELEEKFENLNLNSENVMMSELEQHVHFIFKKTLKLRIITSHHQIFFAVYH